MKRRLLALLLAVLTLTALTAAAFAVGETELGAYNLTGGLKVVDVESDGGFYAGAKKFSLTCKALTGNYSLVLLLDETSGVTGIPTVSNLQYIDQVDIKKGEATFSIIPKAMTDGATYNVYVSTNGENGSLTKVASFQYGPKPPYTLGDINNDTKINADDAVLALRYAVQLVELNTTQISAGDVNHDGKVNAEDAVQILRYAVKLITSF